jgi:Fe-S-cluster containining protein
MKTSGNWVKKFWMDLRAGKLCQECGACCGPESYNEGWAGALTIDDMDRLGKRIVRLHVLKDTDGERLIKTHWTDNGQVCVLLKGQVGQNVTCSIYDKRPQACRDYAAGDERCLSARLRAGIPTPGPVVAQTTATT